VVLGEAFEIVNEPRYDKNLLIIISTKNFSQGDENCNNVLFNETVGWGELLSRSRGRD
jgi:hypothetical protein